MSEVADRYARVAAEFTARVQGCSPADWSAASPCEGWSARDVVAHVVTGHRRALAVMSGEDATPAAEDEDLVAAWRAANAAVTAVLADPERAQAETDTPFGRQPFETLVGTALCADTLVHTWDLARATGQDEHLDPEAVIATATWVTPMDEMMRHPGVFGPKVAPPPGADDQTQLLCFLGRPG
jgi:uncharacterized protein (TIGR03086 family)